MPRRQSIIALIAFAIALIATPRAGSPAVALDSFNTYLRVELTGASVHPGPGDPDAVGTVSMFVYPFGGVFSSETSVLGIDQPIAAHLHAGAAGTVGPELFYLGTPGADGTPSFGGSSTPVDPDLMQDIANNPQNYYVDVHSAEFPDGAVRGQLEPMPVELTAYLRDDEVVPGPGLPGIEGLSRVRLDPQLTEACVAAFSELGGLVPITAATVHQAPLGAAGPVVLSLPIPAVYPDPMACTAGHDPAILQAIIDDPTGFYLTLATSDYPDGAVRGQFAHNQATPPPDPCPTTLHAVECILPPGTYTFEGFATDLTYTTSTVLLSQTILTMDEPRRAAIGFRDPELGGELNAFLYSGLVWTDPCGELLESNLANIGPDPATFIDWLTAHPFLDTTQPIEVEYGGVPAIQLDATVQDAGCVLPWVTLFWFDPGIDGDNVRQHPGTVLRIIVQRIGDQTIVFMTRDFSGLELSVALLAGAGETFIDEAQEIVDSIRWAVAGGTPPAPIPDTAMPASAAP